MVMLTIPTETAGTETETESAMNEDMMIVIRGIIEKTPDVIREETQVIHPDI